MRSRSFKSLFLKTFTHTYQHNTNQQGTWLWPVLVFFILALFLSSDRLLLTRHILGCKFSWLPSLWWLAGRMIKPSKNMSAPDERKFLNWGFTMTHCFFYFPPVLHVLWTTFHWTLLGLVETPGKTIILLPPGSLVDQLSHFLFLQKTSCGHESTLKLRVCLGNFC